MVYDCFLFNDELDLLRLRLEFLKDTVNHFVLVESERTLSGEKKPLHFKNNQDQFKEYSDRIIHLVAPENDLSPWEYEFFQRNYIKEALQKCNADDMIMISDVDEIANIKAVMQSPGFQLPALIELPVHYYYFNLRSAFTFKVNLVASWDFIKEKDLGHRNELFPEYTDNVIHCKDVNTGWHFSYLFGTDIEKYQNKIRSFAHSEYNNTYYLNSKRIKQCITLGIDLFERRFMKFKRNDASISAIKPLLQQFFPGTYFYNSRPFVKLSPAYWPFLFRVFFLNRLKDFFLKNRK
ncbi:MAG TPA: hypothetical protein PLU37_13135 [Chitinophagaceae bacterium]|nr:hypothetical protein [Chitinophagaceae bacterium]HPG12470.1 hypothetical protein [Chitinophagaceae bacterium]